MLHVNLHFGWCWILTGLIVGALLGLGFHRDAWLGGYASWRRRMLRLGHIAFVGTGLLNLGLALSAAHVPVDAWPARWAGWSLLFGAVTMPTVCLLAAWRKPLRHLFFFPVLGLIGGVVMFLVAAALAATHGAAGGG